MPAFVTRRTVRFADCDPAGIVYFPRCFDLLNGVVEDWWAEMGIPWRVMIPERAIGLPTVAMAANFVAPSRLGDELVCTLTVVRLGGASLDLRHSVAGDDGVRFRAEQTVVCTALATNRPQPWPDDLRAAVTRYLESDHAQHPAA
ncbi:acyl-CoA thioesterase [Azospirillum picis]|uniref:4-hydroxybenzoyl-CoA thioesterase n=1 Tax=Azospirillum picis TaxID=488438 RepID=A0ABU0MDV0_9PROT|nr:thioesterase family protein [Azospirillum picis]MBP2297368.1 4-hydroxybenzoyl-CoA thioesterase [Azospirillum picis]MDQ0531609.1 4-hydroxybenzoyl-CoA thioesterase [Azospirillum picis]